MRTYVLDDLYFYNTPAGGYYGDRFGRSVYVALPRELVHKQRSALRIAGALVRRREDNKMFVRRDALLSLYVGDL